MGAYGYCQNCKRPVPGPWDLSNKDLLMGLFMSDLGVQDYKCSACGDFCNSYDKSDLVEELALRLDSFEGDLT